MRAYFWGNYYLSPIQQGIQSLHCLSEMYIKYLPQADEAGPLYDWACNHKTVVILNAGESDSIIKIRDMMGRPDNPYPWSTWDESVSALNGATTSVGIILPERIYEEARFKKKNWRSWSNKRGLNEFELEIIELINRTYMAR